MKFHGYLSLAASPWLQILEAAAGAYGGMGVSADMPQALCASPYVTICSLVPSVAHLYPTTLASFCSVPHLNSLSSFLGLFVVLTFCF